MEGYRVGDVARMAGVTVRTLHHFEELGLLAPARGENGYRTYSRADLDRLQEVLLLREMGVGLGQIRPALSRSADERQELLAEHLSRLRQERDRVDALIRTVERTLDHEKRGCGMEDGEKFEGFKRDMVEENERRWGAEVRRRHGDEAADASNARVMGMSERDYARWKELEEEILTSVERAVREGADALGEEGARVCALHREWLGFTWPSYSSEAHRGLAQAYVDDERFCAYYDRTVAGCAAWLRDAVVAHA